MTKITVFQNRKQEYMGFDCGGHAGFAFRGKDVVCAGISILVQNTVNARRPLRAGISGFVLRVLPDMMRNCL